MSKRQRKLSLEQMESRVMMAGDVTAAISGGTLYLTEAAGQIGLDNAVVISQAAPNVVEVAGNPTTTDGTVGKVNGAAFQVFKFAGNLNVNFGGGSDSVIFSSSAPPTFQNVAINLAAPTVVAAQAAIKAAVVVTTPVARPDNNTVVLWNENIKGSLTINTGAGNDYIYVGNGSVAGPISIATGAGTDSVELQNLQSNVNGAIAIQMSDTSTQTDTVWLDHVNANGDIGIVTGAGNDLIHMNNVTSYEDINVNSGAGNDTVQLAEICAVDDFFASLGAGNDSLTSTDLYVIHGQTQIDAGAGTDSLSDTGAFPSSQLTLSNFEKINGVMVLPIIVLAD